MSMHWRNLGIFFMVLGLASSVLILWQSHRHIPWNSNKAFEPSAYKNGPAYLVFDKKIPLNEASPKDLAVLNGLGPLRAESVVRWRESHGPFRSLEELKKVPGIGQKTFERIQPFLTLQNAEGRWK